MRIRETARGGMVVRRCIELDPSPLDPGTGPLDGVTLPTQTGFPITEQYARSGQSAFAGRGVLIHSGALVRRYSFAQSRGIRPAILMPECCDGPPMVMNQMTSEFAITLTYNSQSQFDGTTGHGMGSALDSKYTVNGQGDVLILMEDGVERVYVSNGAGWTSPTGFRDTLVQTATGYDRVLPEGGKHVYVGGWLSSIQDRFGNATTFTRNTAGQVTSITDSRGRSHSLIYYAATGRLQTVTYPRGNGIKYTLNSAGQPTTVTFPAVTTQTPSVTITNTYTYNSDGTTASFTDGEGKVTSYAYYGSGAKLGLPWKTTVDSGGLALVTELDYESWGAAKSRKDARGYTTTLTVERYGNVTQVAAPSALGYVTKFTHDGNLNVTKREIKNIDHTGTWISSPQWWETTYTYDGNGNLTEVENPRSRATTLSYDLFDRRTQITNALGHYTEFVFDKAGNLTERKSWEENDPSADVLMAHQKRYYDEINRFWKDEGLLQGSPDAWLARTHVLDKRGLATKTTNRRGYDTTRIFDGAGRLTKTTDPMGNIEEYTLDAGGNATTIVDQNGTEIDQSFDALDRLTARDITLATGVGGDTEEDFAYDTLGRLTEAKDDDSTVQLTYDSLSRVLTEKQGASPLGSEAMTVTSTWDGESNRTKIAYPSTFEARRTYSNACCLLDIDDKDDDLIVSYTPIGRRHRRASTALGNGASTDYAYDGFRRTIDISHADSGSTEFAGFEYAWDANSNPLYEARRHDSGAGDLYTYDQANRLTDALIGVADPAAELADPGTETYSEARAYNMDDVLNLTSYVVTPQGGSAATTNFTANVMNEYTAVGGTTHTYDDNGNLKDDGTNTYQYDAHNHLLKVTRKSDSVVLGEYRYDALGRGRRTKKIVGSGTTRFVYSGQSVLEEYDGSGNLLRLFVHSDKIDDVAMMEAQDVADVDGDANTTELKRFYFHGQLIGSITHVTDPDEVVVESYEYGPYGETEIFDASSSSVSASQIGNPFMYTGRRLDEESGLYYYRARHYSPELKRFIQRDPLGYVDGPNAFAYVGGHVVASVDPHGKKFMTNADGEHTQETLDALFKCAGLRPRIGQMNGDGFARVRLSEIGDPCHSPTLRKLIEDAYLSDDIFLLLVVPGGKFADAISKPAAPDGSPAAISMPYRIMHPDCCACETDTGQMQFAYELSKQFYNENGGVDPAPDASDDRMDVYHEHDDERVEEDSKPPDAYEPGVPGGLGTRA